MHPALVHFFLNDTATTEIYTLSLHDALPIFTEEHVGRAAATGLAEQPALEDRGDGCRERQRHDTDRKSTRLNSSHPSISYAVFCLKKKRASPSLLDTEDWWRMRPPGGGVGSG